jgi:hypothetical protein
MQRSYSLGSVPCGRRFVPEVHLVCVSLLAYDICLETVSFGLVADPQLVAMSSLETNSLFIYCNGLPEIDRLWTYKVDPLDERGNFEKWIGSLAGDFSSGVLAGEECPELLEPSRSIAPHVMIQILVTMYRVFEVGLELHIDTGGRVDSIPNVKAQKLSEFLDRENHPVRVTRATTPCICQLPF